MKRPLRAGPVSDLELERYRLDDLPETRATELRRRLIEDDELRGRVEALGSSDRELLRRHPVWLTAAGIRDRTGGLADRPRAVTRPLRIGLWAAPALLAAAVLAAVVLPWARPRPAPPMMSPSEDDSVRIKGLRPQLVLFRKTAAGSEKLRDGDRVWAGDLIRVAYQGAGSAYGVIVSLDGRGAVTVHLPRRGLSAAPLAPDTVLLDLAYELDDAPAFERFYFVTGDRPFEVSAVLQAAQNAGGEPSSEPGRLALHEGFDQCVFSLVKGRPW